MFNQNDYQIGYSLKVILKVKALYLNGVRQEIGFYFTMR